MCSLQALRQLSSSNVHIESYRKTNLKSIGIQITVGTTGDGVTMQSNGVGPILVKVRNVYLIYHLHSLIFPLYNRAGA